MLSALNWTLWGPVSGLVLALLFVLAGRAAGWEQVAGAATWAAAVLALLLPAYLVGLALFRGRRRALWSALTAFGLFAAAWAIPTTSSGFFRSVPFGAVLLIETGDAIWATAGRAASWRPAAVGLLRFDGEAASGSAPRGGARRCPPLVCPPNCSIGSVRDDARAAALAPVRRQRPPAGRSCASSTASLGSPATRRAARCARAGARSRLQTGITRTLRSSVHDVAMPAGQVDQCIRSSNRRDRRQTS